ncbi:hypothetical protein Pcac1_g7044 [Phytophthora cactorum]|nr:hypothetical protein Pcac1_g7044 [Phytophthora cactorum]
MDAGRAPASGLDGSNRYADTLKRYRLYDRSGVIRPLSDGEMRSWFERWRRTRGKRVTVARTVTQNSLNQAWASFVDYWSEETGAVFRETIVARGATHARMSPQRSRHGRNGPRSHAVVRSQGRLQHLMAVALDAERG